MGKFWADRDFLILRTIRRFLRGSWVVWNAESSVFPAVGKLACFRLSPPTPSRWRSARSIPTSAKPISRTRGSLKSRNLSRPEDRAGPPRTGRHSGHLNRRQCKSRDGAGPYQDGCRALSRGQLLRRQRRSVSAYADLRLELILSDLDVIENSLEKARKSAQSGDEESQRRRDALAKAQALVEDEIQSQPAIGATRKNG